ncbi:hypothetical protein KM043_011032 [Ampulex compressa]|nr:hypothetical protein KM043_011032 [Ampulex compressa]
MSRGNDNGISLATPPAIHVGPIVTPGTNETISIVIPLSAQLATVSGQKAENKSCKDCNKDAKPQSAPRPRNDKTKGCPFPNCVRYGRAFSRAHDLKRHIARHEMRKEKLSDVGKQPVSTEYENLVNQAVLQRDRPCGIGTDEGRETVGKLYSCPHCKKKYSGESKLKVHLASHDKLSSKNVCTMCGACFQNAEASQEHMKQQHASAILQGQSVANKSAAPVEKDLNDKDDDFLLEEMLLLNKNPRRVAPGKTIVGGASSKIRCDYCSKTFKTKWTLSSHVAAHEGRFQFDCGQCGKKFVRKSHYEGHVRSHEAARPYICEQCGKTFKELKHRREHTKRKHPTNQNAIQNLLDSISPCASEEMPVDQAKFTLLMPMNFSA